MAGCDGAVESTVTPGTSCLPSDLRQFYACACPGPEVTRVVVVGSALMLPPPQVLARAQAYSLPSASSSWVGDAAAGTAWPLSPATCEGSRWSTTRCGRGISIPCSW